LVIALFLRLLFLNSLVHSAGTERLFQLSTDMRNYFGAAERIYRDFLFDHDGVLIFGPGYPTIIAILGAPFKMSAVAILTCQVLLSSVFTVLMAALTMTLTGRKSVGLVAGGLSAASLLAILYASFLWSETVFMLLVATSLFLLIEGMRCQRRWLCALSGALLGVAILTRSMAQGLPFMFVVIGIVYLWPIPLRQWRQVTHRLSGPLIAGAVALSISNAWVVRNYLVYDIPQVALASPMGLGKVNRLAMSSFEDIPYATADSLFVEKMRAHPDGFRKAIYTVGVSEFRRYVTERPWSMALLLARNGFKNMTAESTTSHMPTRFKGIYKYFARILGVPGIKYRGLVLACLGALILLIQRHYRALMILVLLYLYFGAIGAFAIDQGSRIFFPAQIASLGLMSVALVQVGAWARTGGRHIVCWLAKKRLRE